MDTPWIPQEYWEKIPHTLTVITTYKCNAACKECCFECNPRLSARLSYKDISGFIDEAIEAFPGLRLVVFSGGECFLLGRDLLDSIRYAHGMGLFTRCVTNGYWGKTDKSASLMASKLTECGLNELNVSTGADHAEWVPVEHALNSAKAAARQGIYCVVTVEQDKPDSQIVNLVRKDSELADLERDGKLKIQINSWMPFHKGAVERGFIQNKEDMLCQGCDQVLENCVLTPYGEVSGCCGLTFEHIPEMKIDLQYGFSLRDSYSAQAEDFLKIWLKVDGPYQIIRKISGSKYESALEKIVHPCQACALLHQDEGLRQGLVEQYKVHIERVLRSFFSSAQIKCNVQGR